MEKVNEILQKGTVVKVGGFPVELAEDVPIVGSLPEVRDTAASDAAHTDKESLAYS